jgi:hypothetical protein
VRAALESALDAAAAARLVVYVQGARDGERHGQDNGGRQHVAH